MICHIMAPVPLLPDSLKKYQPLIDKMMAKNPKDRFSSAIVAVGSHPMACLAGLPNLQISYRLHFFLAGIDNSFL